MNMNVVAMIAGGLVLGTAVVVPMEFNQVQAEQKVHFDQKLEQPTFEPQVVEEPTGNYVQAESLNQIPNEPAPLPTPVETPTIAVDQAPISVPSYSDDDDESEHEDYGDDDESEHEGDDD